MRQTPITMYWASGTRNHRFHNIAAPTALHRAGSTGRVTVFLKRIRQKIRVNRPASSVVSRWLCNSPVKPMASGAQHQGSLRRSALTSWV